MSTAITDHGERIAYDRHGSGTPLVLLPGFQSWRLSWEAYGYIDALGTAFDVICIDPMGHYESDAPHDPAAYSCDRMVAHLDAVLDDCHLEAAHLWGFSRGGMLAALYGRHRTERVLSVVMGAAPYGRCAVPLSAQMVVGERFLARRATGRGTGPRTPSPCHPNCVHGSSAPPTRRRVLRSSRQTSPHRRSSTTSRRPRWPCRASRTSVVARCSRRGWRQTSLDLACRTTAVLGLGTPRRWRMPRVWWRSCSRSWKPTRRKDDR